MISSNIFRTSATKATPFLGILSIGFLAAPQLGAQATSSATTSVVVGTAASADVPVKSIKVGKGLYEIVFNPENNSVYVASAGGRGDSAKATIQIVDAKTMEVKSSIETPANPQYGLGINTKTQMLYGTDTRNGKLIVTDLKTGKQVAVVGDPNQPKAHLRHITVDEEANKIYVSNYSRVASVWIVDGKTNKLEAVIENTGNGTSGIAIDKAKNLLYVSNASANEVGVVDLATRKLVNRFPANGESSIGLEFDPVSRKIFVANQKSNTVTIMHADSGKVTDTVANSEGALSIAINSKLGRAYVANRRAGTVTIIDIATGKAIESVATGSLPQTIAIDPKTNSVFVSNKAKGGPRGSAPVEDPNGDTLAKFEQ